MRVAFVWDKTERKLQSDHYSQSYRGMFTALRDKCDYIQDINEDCDAKDIDTDIVLFFDIHSSHHISIKGLEKHPSRRYEYLDDPHQIEHSGVWQGGVPFHKLGPKQRMNRARERGVNFIVCPYKEEYLHYLYPYSYPGCHVISFPVVPAIGLFKNRNNSWSNRANEITCSGSTISDNGEYDFRIWALDQLAQLGPYGNRQQMLGRDYPTFLALFKFGLAACTMPVPKYFEIALAGCLPIMQWNINTFEYGFRHGENCLFVSKNNFVDTVKYVIKNPNEFETIAHNAQKLVETQYTNVQFAESMLNHFKRHLHG